MGPPNRSQYQEMGALSLSPMEIMRRKIKIKKRKKSNNNIPLEGN
jgi:hypothetical protein